MRQDRAETLALEALAWLATNDELLPVFMGSTGASEDDIRVGATDPAFLGSVLEFILMDDRWVLEFAEVREVPPEDLMVARQALPGGEQVHWT